MVIHDAGIDRRQVNRTFADFDTFGEFRLIQRLGDLHLPRLPPSEPLVVQCEHFVDCITTGAAPISGAEEAAAVVEVLGGGDQVTQGRRRTCASAGKMTVG